MLTVFFTSFILALLNNSIHTNFPGYIKQHFHNYNDRRLKNKSQEKEKKENNVAKCKKKIVR